MNFPPSIAPPAPCLVESTMRRCVGAALQKSHTLRETKAGVIRNVASAIILASLIGLLVYVNMQFRKTPEEKKEADRRRKKYVMDTIANYQDARRSHQQNMLTGLPMW